MSHATQLAQGTNTASADADPATPHVSEGHPRGSGIGAPEHLVERRRGISDHLLHYVWGLRPQRRMEDPLFVRHGRLGRCKQAKGPVSGNNSAPPAERHVDGFFQVANLMNGCRYFLSALHQRRHVHTIRRHLCCGAKLCSASPMSLGFCCLETSFVSDSDCRMPDHRTTTTPDGSLAVHCPPLVRKNIRDPTPERSTASRSLTTQPDWSEPSQAHAASAAPALSCCLAFRFVSFRSLNGGEQ